MNKQIAQQIATTIRQQLMCTGGRKQKVMSWGAHAWAFDIEKVGDYERALLRFRVRGLKFKGVVKIYLNEGRDVYFIRFFRGRQVEHCHEITEVYCEEMTDIIDRYVEYTGDKTSYKNALQAANVPTFPAIKNDFDATQN